MVDNAQIRLGYAYDKQSERQVTQGVRRIQERLDKLSDIQGALKKRLDDGTISLKGYQAGLKATEKEARELNRALNQIDPPTDVLADRLNTRNDRFDDVSRNVGFAGDVQSNIGAGQALLDAAGAGGVSQGLGVAGEVVVLAEELPRLKESLAGMPDVARAAYQSIGPLGVGIAALATVAAVTFAELDRIAQENSKEIKGAIEGFRELQQDIAKGLTSDEARQRLEELTKARDAEDKTLKAAESTYKNYIDSVGAGAIGVKALSREEETHAEQVEISKSNLKDMNQELAGLEALLESSALAANDAAAAEAARTEALLSEAQTAGQTVAVQERARNATVAANESRLQAIDSETAAIQAEIAVLESSGNTSEEVAARIAELNGQLSQLGDESSFIKDTALDLARAREQEAEAQKAQEKAQADAQRAAERRASEIERAEQQIASARRKAADTTSKAKTKLSRTNADISTDLDRTFTDIATKTRRGIKQVQAEIAEAQFEAQLDNFQDEQTSLRQHYDTLEDIRTDALNSEEDLFRGRDFLGLRDLARDTERQRQQETTALEREQREQDIQLNQEIQDIERQGELKRQQRLEDGRDERADARLAARRKRIDAREATRRDIIDAKEAARAEIALAQQTIQQKLQLEQQYAQQSLAITQGLVDGAGAAGAAATTRRAPSIGVAGTTLSGVFSANDLVAQLRGRRRPRTLTDELTSLGFA